MFAEHRLSALWAGAQPAVIAHCMLVARFTRRDKVSSSCAACMSLKKAFVMMKMARK